jgi:predicted nucleic acid-binding Zn ribbon protein
MKKKDIVPFEAALKIFLKEKKWSQKIKGYQIISDWENLAGKEIAQSSQPIKIQDKCLFLAVKSNVWANELNLRKGELIEKINREAGEEIISNILFKTRRLQFKDS